MMNVPSYLAFFYFIYLILLLLLLLLFYSLFNSKDIIEPIAESFFFFFFLFFQTLEIIYNQLLNVPSYLKSYFFFKLFEFNSYYKPLIIIK